MVTGTARVVRPHTCEGEATAATADGITGALCSIVAMAVCPASCATSTADGAVQG